jgi:hypothetical protein
MADYLSSGAPRKLDFGFRPSPSGGGLYAIQEEEFFNCCLVMLGYAPDLDDPGRVECPALVTSVGFVQFTFGYPNEEAFLKDPRGLGHGLYEIEGSTWSDAIDDYNMRSFGEPYFRWSRPLRHYFIGSKDSSCQVLAQGLTVEPLPGLSFSEVVARIPERIHDRSYGSP